MSSSDQPRPEEEARPTPPADPIYQFLEAISQRYQKDLQGPSAPAGELISQLDRALKHLERSPWAERVAAELPYGIAMALGAWLVEGFAYRREAELTPQRSGERPESKVNLESLLVAEPITLELGRNLVGMVTGQAPLLARITALRRHFARTFGLVVPGIRCRDNLELDGDNYLILIDDLPAGSGVIRARELLAVGPAKRLQELDLTPAPDPVYGMPSAWLDPARRSLAESYGCLMVDPVSALMSHLTRLLRRHGHRLLGREQVGYLLKLNERTHPALIREVRRRLSPGLVRKILGNLLFEQLSIRRLPTVLEGILDEADQTLDPEFLTQAARRALGRQLTLEHESPKGVLLAMTMSAELAQALREDLSGRRLRPDPALKQSLRSALDQGVANLAALGAWPVLVIDSDLRWAFKRWSYPHHPDLVVLASDEVDPEVALEVEGNLGFVEE